jgi:hypothetical protein
MKRVAVAVGCAATAAVVLVAFERKASPPMPVVLDRSAVKDRMVQHFDDMTDLLFSIVLGDHATAGHLAHAMASEPRFARDTAKVDPKSSASFLRLQEELRVRAARLADDANARDDRALASDYGRLVETCAACHRSYLKDSAPTGGLVRDLFGVLDSSGPSAVQARLDALLQGGAHEAK